MFHAIFRGNTVFHACSLGCLPELSNDNDQLSTSYALLRHDCFNVLTNIDLDAFIPMSSEISDLCEVTGLFIVSVILLLRIKEQSLAITFLMCVV